MSALVSHYPQIETNSGRSALRSKPPRHLPLTSPLCVFHLPCERCVSSCWVCWCACRDLCDIMACLCVRSCDHSILWVCVCGECSKIARRACVCYVLVANRLCEMHPPCVPMCEVRVCACVWVCVNGSI